MISPSEMLKGVSVTLPLSIATGFILATAIPEAQLTGGETIDLLIRTFVIAGPLFAASIIFIKSFFDSYTSWHGIPGYVLGLIVVMFVATWFFPIKFLGITMLVMLAIGFFALYPQRSFICLPLSLWFTGFVYVLAKGYTSLTINVLPPPDSGFMVIFKGIANLIGDVVRSIWGTFQMPHINYQGWSFQVPQTSLQFGGGQGLTGDNALILFGAVAVVLFYCIYYKKDIEKIFK